MNASSIRISDIPWRFRGGQPPEVPSYSRSGRRAPRASLPLAGVALVAGLAWCTAALGDPPITDCELHVEGVGIGYCGSCTGQTNGVQNCTYQQSDYIYYCAGECQLGTQCEELDYANVLTTRVYACDSNCVFNFCQRGDLMWEDYSEQPSECGDCIIAGMPSGGSPCRI